MPRTKKTAPTEIIEVSEIVSQINPILPLSIDYPTEGLNNMARKINEIIDRVNE